MSVPDFLWPRLPGRTFEGHPVPPDFQSQLDELKVLKDGWLDGKGLAPRAEGLDWLGEAFGEHCSDLINAPYVYPVAEGGVRLEWSFGPRDVSLEVDLASRSGEWHSLDLDTDEEEARTLKLDSTDDWKWIVERLQILGGVGP